MRTQSFIWPLLASLQLSYGQTSSACNPLKVDCPSDPALGKPASYDFTKGSSPDWSLSTGSEPTFDSTGAKFTIAKSLDSPTVSSNWYMMFGHYDIVAKSSPGQGVISSLVLLSDDLDEIDFEFLGARNNEVQLNYFGKGITGNYDRGTTNPVATPQDVYHTYSLDWTAEKITWAVDGNVIRTLTAEAAEPNQFPQSPMRLKIGTWPSGDPSASPGVVGWGGGPIDYAKGPYTMTVKSVKVTDYSTGRSYSYGNRSGSWQSIKSDGGTINPSGDKNTPPSSASSSASSSSISMLSTSTASLGSSSPSSSSPWTKSGTSSSSTPASSAASSPNGVAINRTTSGYSVSSSSSTASIAAGTLSFVNSSVPFPTAMAGSGATVSAIRFSSSATMTPSPSAHASVSSSLDPTASAGGAASTRTPPAYPAAGYGGWNATAGASSLSAASNAAPSASAPSLASSSNFIASSEAAINISALPSIAIAVFAVLASSVSSALLSA